MAGDVGPETGERHARGRNIPPRLGGRAAWWLLAVVCLTQAVSMLDRQVLAILVPRVKADLQVGDAEIGLLYGTVFALFYALFSLPLGRLADGWVRTRLLGICILVWSAMTALGGFAGSFSLLGIARLGVGIGEAAAQPAGFSLLADSFPKRMKGTVTAAMASAVSLGLGGALWLGGGVAGWWEARFPDHNGPLGLSGWQAAFLAAALPGPVLAGLLFSLREPVRGAADGIVSPPDPHPFGAALATLGSVLPGFAWIGFVRRGAGWGTWAVNLAGLAAIVVGVWWLTGATGALRAVNPPALVLGGIALDGNALQWLVTGIGSYSLLCWLQSLRLGNPPTFALIARSPAVWLTLAVASLQMAINYAVQGWVVSFALRSYGADPAVLGREFGLLSGAIGVVGPLIAGLLSDRIATRVKSGRLYVTLASILLSAGLAQLVFRAPSLGAFYGLFVPFAFAATMWAPAIYATLLDLVLPRMRGVVISLYLLATTIFGMGIGPYVVGLVSDGNGGRLGPAILSIYWVAPAMVLLILLLIRRLPRDEALILPRARAAGEPV